MEKLNIREDVKKRLLNGDYSCSKEYTLSIISGKWKIVILYHLGHEGAYHFNELMRLLPKITHRILTKQLRELEEDGVIYRYNETINHRKYTFYVLTSIGESLIPIIVAMYDWGEQRIDALKLTPKYNISDD
ncbi:winged helix-turn-helix transcriptional regulator [Staphylococcus succinus]|uniref:winged helix-turn-helix transcriptional regulator n=1 Tax=Staphylococcus succinus TaxID=61015 RepID=UPI000E6A6AF7|nr:helix-turn-helix domain-containing protein [Staphylococcus succinus]RIN27613.1 transcriptional regulator [Staphylococcus succinus]